QARELPKGVLRLRLRARRAFRRAGRRAPARRRQHRGRIEAVNNACRAREVVVEEGSLAAFVWRFERANTPWSRRSARPRWRRSPAPRTSSDAKFVGPTTAYAFMQAMGLVDDHAPDCVVRAEVERARTRFARPGR